VKNARHPPEVLRCAIFFLAGNTSALGGFFPDQERKIPGNPEIPEVFPGQEVSNISDIPGFPGGDGDHSLTFLTVQRECGAVQRTRRSRCNCSWFSLRTYMAHREYHQSLMIRHVTSPGYL
jgi:hypothetical protein